MRPQRSRSRDWFTEKVAVLGALVRTFPRPRQLALFEQLAEDGPTQTPAAGTVDVPRQPHPGGTE